MKTMICLHCEEPILEDDDRSSVIDGRTGVRRWRHFECGMRAVIGSLAHLERRCSCYVEGATETDPEGMTRREAAVAAWEAWRRLQPRTAAWCAGARSIPPTARN